MNDVLTYALVAGVVFLTHFQQGITGFGCTVLAMPFVTLLIGLETAVPVLIIQGWVLAALTVADSWRKIVWREFAWIAVLMGLGMPVGIWMATRLPADTLKVILGIFCILVGIEGLIKQLWNARPSETASPSRRWLSVFLPMAGVFHGAFATGGPLLVIYATRAITDKSLFRVTLCLVWVTLNSILIVQRAVQGAMTLHVLLVAALLAPFSFLGFYGGNRAHYRVNDVLFRRIVFLVLAAVGGFLVWSVLGR